MKAKKFLKSVDGVTILIYGIVALFANYVGFLAYIIAVGASRGIAKSMLGMWILAIIPMIPAILLSSIYIRRCIDEQYVYSEGKVSWLRNFLIFILPGELFRFLISLTDLGHSSGTGYVNFTPSFIFENLYIYPSGQNTRIRMDQQYTFTDYAVYILCYLIYLLIYVLILMAIYRFFWHRIDSENKKLKQYADIDKHHRNQF